MGGNIGALAIVDNQYKVHFYAASTPPTEIQLLDYFISPELTVTMERLFGSETRLSTSLPEVIAMLYGDIVTIVNLPDIANNVELKRYIKCGLVLRNETGAMKFTNAMSRRFFIYKTYPRTATSNPTNSIDLVINSIRKISATTLVNSVVESGFPKEAVFQHLIMSGMTANLTAQTHVYPENSRVIGTDNKIKGELDFFINGELRWGIELLIQGRKLKEHRARFIGNGRYVNLTCREYVVVDFRGNLTGKPKKLVTGKDNVITVYLKLNDYRKAMCLLPDESFFEVDLSN